MSSPHSHPRRGDRGFTLIEVIVALGLLALVTAALTPQVIAGLRAAGTARDVTQAKGVAQARLEVMRNMPFFVGRSAGEYIDVLDSYYPNLTTPVTVPGCKTGDEYAFPPTSWTGYVPAGAARCEYEPTGALYRKVINPVSAPGLGVFSMVVDTQFLSAHSIPQPVTPIPAYNAQVAGKDVPAGMQLGVTVTVFYQTQSGPRWSSTYTQIERTAPISPLIVSEAAASTVRISSMAETTGMPGGCVDGDVNTGCINLTSDIGVVNLEGELFTGSRVNAYATSGVAGTSLGDQIQAASANAVSPPDTATLSDVEPPVTLGTNCALDLACFGTTMVDQVQASASDGLPRAGTPLAPVRALIPETAGYDGFRFNNGPAGSHLGLDPAVPMVSLDSAPAPLNGIEDCGPTATATTSHLTATGYLDATKDVADPKVDTCATAQTAAVVLFPTAFAPDGVVRIQLTQAAAQCTVTTTAGAKTPQATATYNGTVSWSIGGGNYASATFTQNTVHDVLSGINLATTKVGVLGGSDRYLGDYISSWRTLPKNGIVKTTTDDTAKVDIQGIVTIDTQPTRHGAIYGPAGQDPASVLSLQVGSLSCKAGDFR